MAHFKHVTQGKVELLHHTCSVCSLTDIKDILTLCWPKVILTLCTKRLLPVCVAWLLIHCIRVFKASEMLYESDAEPSRKITGQMIVCPNKTNFIGLILPENLTTSFARMHKKYHRSFTKVGFAWFLQLLDYLGMIQGIVWWGKKKFVYRNKSQNSVL